MLTEPDVCYKIRSMKQASLNLDLLSKKTRKQTFLDEMEKVVPWANLEALIASYYCEGVKGRPPFALQTMVRTHFMQQWFTLSDPAMEEAFVDTPLYRHFAQIEEFIRLPVRAIFCVLAKPQVHVIGWRSTNWQSRSWVW